MLQIVVENIVYAHPEVIANVSSSRLYTEKLTIKLGQKINSYFVRF